MSGFPLAGAAMENERDFKSRRVQKPARIAGLPESELPGECFKRSVSCPFSGLPAKKAKML